MRRQRPVWLASILAVLLNAAGTMGQGTFQSLDFEAADVPVVPPGKFGSDVSVSNGVPGWTVYLGGSPQSSMLHNNMSLGNQKVSSIKDWVQAKKAIFLTVDHDILHELSLQLIENKIING